MASLRSGRAGAGGSHGGVSDVARDAYAVIGSYVASLLGIGPRDHTLSHGRSASPFRWCRCRPSSCRWRWSGVARRGRRGWFGTATAAVADWLDRRQRILATPGVRP